MEVIYCNSKNFDETVKNGKALIDFYADWCGPCKMIAPVLVEVAANNPDIKVIKVNVDEEPELAAKYSVSSIPALFVLLDGKVLDSKNGFLPKEMLVKWVKETN